MFKNYKITCKYLLKGLVHPKMKIMSLMNRKTIQCWIKTKMYFRCFKTFLLTQWCHMDYTLMMSLFPFWTRTLYRTYIL